MKPASPTGCKYSVAVLPFPVNRLALSLKTISGMKYTVMVRDKLGGGDAEAVQFATTPDGPLSASQFTGNGKTGTLYLQPVGDAGFIQVVRE